MDLGTRLGGLQLVTYSKGSQNYTHITLDRPYLDGQYGCLGISVGLIPYSSGVGGGRD